MNYLCLLMVLLTAAHAIRNSYVIITPNTIRPGMKLGVTVSILKKADMPTMVGIALFKDGARFVHGAVVFRDTEVHKPKKIYLKVPDVLEPGTYTIHAQARGRLSFYVAKSISYATKDKSVFIQSDKAIYKPGDKVQFRALSLLPSLKPYTGGVNISVHDSASNKIYQWHENKGPYGVVTKDFELSSKPVLGDWKIKVEAGTQSVEKTISIAHYVLPKFQVEVLMPSYVLTNQEEIAFTVKSKYTYGKPVSGHMKIYAKLVNQHQDYESSTRKEFFQISDDIDGKIQINIAMETLKKSYSYINYYKIAIKAEVEETLTGNVMVEYGYVTIYRSGVTLKFPAINPETFKPGLLYTAYLSVAQPDGLPLAVLDDEVEVTVSVTAPKEPEPPEPSEPQPTEPGATGPPPTTMPPTTTFPHHYPYPQEYTYVLKKIQLSVPGNGLAVFSFNVPAHAKTVRLNARYKFGYASKSLEKSHSPSNSFLQVTLSEFSAVKTGSEIQFTVNSTMPMPSLVYQIISRGQIVAMDVVQGQQRSEFTFNVLATSQMAPNARILIYFVRDDGEIVVDTIGFDVSGAFENKVGLKLSMDEAEPGQDVRVYVTAAASSHAFLLGLDQSVLLLKSGNDITPDEVYDDLEKYDTISHTNDHTLRSPILEDANFGMDRSRWWPYPIFYGGSDASKIFQTAGVIVITDALVYKYVPPNQPYYPIPGTRMMTFAARTEGPVEEGGEAAGGLQSVERIRKYFPETWIWTEIRTCDSGEALVVAKVPDTITSWIISAFAVHTEMGFGISASTSKLVVFKPFFISLNLPYSVIRGEYVAIQVIVFNYMADDQLVKVTMPRSLMYYNIYIDCNGVEDRLQVHQVHSFKVKAGQSRSVYFPIVPIVLGHIDIEVRAQSSMAADGIRKQLLVEAEGVAMEFNKAVLIDLTSQHNLYTESFEIELPVDIVEGSQLAKISAIGDIMGPSIAGLDKLLRLPTGCGEQTLLSLAPDVYITEYLQKTKQLSGAISEKAITFMQKGYQQELSFKHRDGSFSAFGERDKSGSMWLTAFVAKVFHQASTHIFVDPTVIKKAIAWMISKQDTNGSFPEPGRVIHKNMQGKSSSGIALTAFVLISLYENEDLYKDDSQESERYHTARNISLKFLETEIGRSDDLYLMAMAAYAFQLAGSEHLSDVLLKLSQKATQEDGLTFWHLPEEKKERPGRWHYPNQCNAIDTEVTSYVLLTLALQKDLSSGRSILQWVTQQRNPHGGFCSTQDTVVALQALSEFAELVYSDMFNVNAKVTFDEQTSYTFNVNQKNALVTQRRQTNVIPTHVEVTGQGQGLALVEIAVSFNVEKEIEDESYSLDIMTMNETMNHFTLQVCTSRLGSNSSTGMVVAEIGVLSGFVVDKSSITKLDIIKDIGAEHRKVVIYFDEITSETVCVKLRMDRVDMVSKTMPALVRIYDYYEPDFQGKAFYTALMFKNVSICKICPLCENCEEEKQEATTPEVVQETAIAEEEPPVMME